MSGSAACLKFSTVHKGARRASAARGARTQRRKVVYIGRVFSISREARRLPNGRTTQVDVIKHPGAALIVPFLDQERVVFLRQFRPVLNDYLFELPAGTRDRKETLPMCARRELVEEAGFTAERLELLGKIHPAPGYSTETIFVYGAYGLKKSASPCDPDEVFTRRVMTKTLVRRLFGAGRITDAKTIAALALCGWL